jgi:hypothetical protein
MDPRQQIDEMKEVEGKRSEQEKEISELEGEISRLQQEHFERLQDLKSKFLQEKADFQAQATLKVRSSCPRLTLNPIEHTALPNLHNWCVCVCVCVCCRAERAIAIGV